jgi:NADH-quinone oxidoreductase subunit A
MNQFLPVFAMITVATGLAVLVVMISILFGPRKRNQNPAKIKPYESGMNAIGSGQRRLPVRFYLIAVLFILFDVEVIFMYPWAVSLRALGPGAFVQMLIFLGILFAGFVWLLKKGALNWETMDK